MSRDGPAGEPVLDLVLEGASLTVSQRELSSISAASNHRTYPDRSIQAIAAHGASQIMYGGDSSGADSMRIDIAATAGNPFGAAMAGAVVLAAPVVALFVVFQRYFTSTDLGSGVKG